MFLNAIKARGLIFTADTIREIGANVRQDGDIVGQLDAILDEYRNFKVVQAEILTTTTREVQATLNTLRITCSSASG